MLIQESAEAIWSGALDVLRSLLKQDIFDLWFRPIKPVSFEPDSAKIELAVANDFSGFWLSENYGQIICEALATAAGKQLGFEFVTLERESGEKGVDRRGDAQQEEVVLGREVKPPAEEAAPRTQSSEPKKKPIQSEFIFNPNNTFSTFVVGDNNHFAHAAAMAVAQSPGKAYNPLFLYSGVGLGKTHLLHAIGQQVQHNKPHLKVAYISSEKFINEYIDAIQNSTFAKFRKKYRETDVLLIDDIQFLAGKERIQEEFFHTFNALHEARKQIVLTSDRPSAEIKGLESRLVSRFEWGMTVDLQPPDVETRTAILRKKAELMNVRMSEDALSYIATKVRANVRRLEGAFTRVASYSQLTGKEVSIKIVEQLLQQVLHEESKQTVTVDVIQRRVADHYDLRLSDILGRRRPGNIAFARQVAMYLCRKLTGRSLSSIGDAFGGRDHGTVMHACRAVEDRMETEPDVRQSINYLETQILR